MELAMGIVALVLSVCLIVALVAERAADGRY